ncbi:MAG: bifunctional glutamate N-acetyltransferase/amino-acid acetyltransferase ArgJ [Phycisphaeraceae bacterium]|nr:bifunctional glutamate N-acetyltransferase/amino-acid acetyltransferase ArgJ [Phycisphaeraceae bacterium]
MSITRPLGFRAAAVAAGLKPSGKPDLTLIVCDGAEGRDSGTHAIEAGRSAAAVFTTNAIVGAPIEIGRRWRSGQSVTGRGLRAILVNAGAANAATGEDGVRDAELCMDAVASALSCRSDEVLPSSTGVIGRRLPVDRIVGAVPGLVQSLGRGERADVAAAQAIMTTDLVAKSSHREVEIRGHTVHIGAIAKGSGMIAPRLDRAGRPLPPQATMLAFISTDAPIGHWALQRALEGSARNSFDRISVDAHPSCSDTVIAMSSGAAPVPALHEDMPEYHAFRLALHSLCEELAWKIVRDGEGATRVFRVEVRGAPNNEDAERMARAVVDSPLVKCAVHGKDPNWGRVVTAAGNAGVRFDAREGSLSIGGVEVYRHGLPTGVDKSDQKLRMAMSADPVTMTLTVGDGDGHAWMMGCDLSADYVKINAEYTT